MKQELVAKGALSASHLPQHVEFKPDEKKPATLTPIAKLWTEDQRKRFGSEVLLTGGWFLECRPNYVPEEEIDLVPLSEPSLAGEAPMEIDDDDNEEEAFESVPAPKPKSKRKARGRGNTIVASPPPMSSPVVTPPPVAPPAVVRRVERAPLASTQVSQPTVLNPPSPRRLNMDVDSGHSPDRSNTVGHFSGEFPILKGIGATSSKSFQLTLPMFLEHGSFPALLSKYHEQKFMDTQLLRVVDHINKVTIFILRCFISSSLVFQIHPQLL